MGDEEAQGGGIRARGEEALGELAQALLENPVFNQALAKALGAGERAVRAQRTAVSALNLPLASDLARLGQRLRSVSDRLEAIEDRLDDVAADVAALRGQAPAAAASSGDSVARAGAAEGAGR